MERKGEGNVLNISGNYDDYEIHYEAFIPMRLRLHLISMPWAEPTFAPIQIASLKAYIQEKFPERFRIHTYSPALSIPVYVKGADFEKFSEQFSKYEENIYLLLFLRRFGLPGISNRSLHIQRLMNTLNRGKIADMKLSQHSLCGLDKSTIDYIKNRIAPRFLPQGLNLIGFSLVFSQVYASIFCARYIQQNYSQFRPIFLFGGDLVGLPKVVKLLQEHLGKGICVVGEGERKLEWIIQSLLQGRPGESETSLFDRIRSLGPGIFLLQSPGDPGKTQRECHSATQLSRMEMVPLPSYGDYFLEMKDLSAGKGAYVEFRRKKSFLLLSGSRGCPQKCDFCGLNRNWRGYRQYPGHRIAQDAVTLSKRYRTEDIIFADALCDFWAESYSEELIGKKIRMPVSLMELRSHHPESFWTKLSLAGVKGVQLGIESFSTPLLVRMGKKVAAIQNLRAQKYLRELGINSTSNLILFHPRSIQRDILETQRIVQSIPHLDELGLSKFSFTIGSPLYRRLTPEKREKLKESFPSSPRGRLRAVYPLPLRDWALIDNPDGGDFTAPAGLALNKMVYESWERFESWYERFKKNRNFDDWTLAVTRFSDHELNILDTRYDTNTEHYLEGDEAKIYDVCHAGLSLAEIADQTRLPDSRIKKIINGFIQKKIMIEVDRHYLSLALRPRDELVRNYYRNAHLK